MNFGKINFKNEISAVKKKIKKGIPGKKKKSAHQGQSKGWSSPADGSRRSLVFHVPVALQTVIAVLVCCGVLLVAGFAVLGVQQDEINSLKGDLKAYSDDGVVPAGSMDSSVSLNIEAVAGRVTALQKMINSSADNTLSNEDLQWIGVELDEIFVESQILNEVLNDIEANKTLKSTYKDAVQSPLVSLQESYDALKVKDSDVADPSVANGAATNNGAFKSDGGMQAGVKWGIVIGVLLLVSVVLCFLFRHKLAEIFRRFPGVGKVVPPKKTMNSRGKTAVSQRSGKKAAPSVVSAEKKAAKAPVSMKAADLSVEQTELTDVAVSVAENAAAGKTTEATDAPVVDENEAFLEELAPALRKLAEKERQNAMDGSGMIAPSTEDLMTFDDSVISQAEIEDEEDVLFTKHDEKNDQ